MTSYKIYVSLFRGKSEVIKSNSSRIEYSKHEICMSRETIIIREQDMSREKCQLTFEEVEIVCH